MTVAELQHAVKDDFHNGVRFEVRGTITAEISEFNYVIRDKTGYCHVRCTDKIHVNVGDVIKAAGHLGLERNGGHLAYANTIDVIGHDKIPEPVDVESGQICEEALRYQLVRVVGVVVDAMRDEIDQRWSYMMLRGTQGTFLVAIPQSYSDGAFRRMVGAKVSVTGVVCGPSFDGVRKLLDWHVTARSLKDVDVIEPVEENPSAIPPIESLGDVGAIAVTRMNRRRTEGIVLAAWMNFALIKQDDGRLVRIDIIGEKLPRCGDRIAAVGFPETDLFNINLSRTTFRKIGDTTTPQEKPISVSIEDLTSGPYGKNQMQMQYYGRTIKLEGRILDSAKSSGRSMAFTLACGEELVRVYLSAGDVTEVEPDSEVEVTGVCVINTENWRPSDVFPRIKGLTLVPRSPDDIRILSRPPWWTVRRLAIAVAVLAVTLLAFLLWNRVLRRTIERRGQQLLDVEVAKVESELRTNERTRLAADLHDSIVQTLAGVEFQVGAAEKTLPPNANAAAGYLKVARRTLGSCREELRRCLSDLRSCILEEPNMAEALRKTVCPCIDDAEIEFNLDICRENLSDTTAHNILNIVRELCVNAVRHGRAHRILVTGTNTDDRLQIVVQDDGRGFDPATRAGPSQGHFGLQGVKERLNRMGGRLRIESEPGKGSRITVEVLK